MTLTIPTLPRFGLINGSQIEVQEVVLSATATYVPQRDYGNIAIWQVCLWCCLSSCPIGNKVAKRLPNAVQNPSILLQGLSTFFVPAFQRSSVPTRSFDCKNHGVINSIILTQICGFWWLFALGQAIHWLINSELSLSSGDTVQLWSLKCLCKLSVDHYN